MFLFWGKEMKLLCVRFRACWRNVLEAGDKNDVHGGKACAYALFPRTSIIGSHSTNYPTAFRLLCA